MKPEMIDLILRSRIEDKTDQEAADQIYEALGVPASRALVQMLRRDPAYIERRQLVIKVVEAVLESTRMSEE